MLAIQTSQQHQTTRIVERREPLRARKPGGPVENVSGNRTPVGDWLNFRR